MPTSNLLLQCFIRGPPIPKTHPLLDRRSMTAVVLVDAPHR